FRPFVYRLARELRLSGWVLNGPSGVRIEAEGPRPALERFLRRVVEEKPAAASILRVSSRWGAARGNQDFLIRASSGKEERSAWVLPDLATCPDCLQEISEPGQRRRAYPFTNCTLCGPRFTIVASLPYDRANTTMSGFPLCKHCSSEYQNPLDRRFHAQPIACPACGPKLWLEKSLKGSAADAQSSAGSEAPLAPGEYGPAALEAAARLIEKGRIVAIKGIGGFLLLCDARRRSAVRRLRARKRRKEKPFAVLFPDIGAVRLECTLTAEQAACLRSQAAPIVLLRKHRYRKNLAREIAPGNARLGAMLPYAPLHHLLMKRLRFPVVATSGNLSEEPIAAGNAEARAKLSSIADAFLMHDRPIARPADDSIMQVHAGAARVLRRGRGLAPMPLAVPLLKRRVLALGAHLKNTVSIGFGRQIICSQHLGDLENGSAYDAFLRAEQDLRALYEFEPEVAACDLHEDYLSTRRAQALGIPVLRVQHHAAHAASCMAEHGLSGPVLAVAFDGLGLGTDGTLWGGEFLRVGPSDFERIAHLRTFPLPGGSAAVREGRRAALGLLHEAKLSPSRLKPLFTDLPSWDALNRLPSSSRLSPRTSSVGRLFDAVAALAGLKAVNAFEGQAAMSLEQSLDPSAPLRGTYPWSLAKPQSARGQDAGLAADWAPCVEALLKDLDSGIPVSTISARFHNSLARLVLQVAKRAGIAQIVLTGGVFQNAYLLDQTAKLLREAGFSVFTHERVPCNDGGISVGQAYWAGRLCVRGPMQDHAPSRTHAPAGG
ncbi:MAG: carbamoyltransferase HypF, partial [Elusimicrobiota bacterium]